MQKTLSIPQIQEDFLIENPDLSPSKLLQSKIYEIMENRKHSKAHLIRLQKANEVLQDKVFELQDKIKCLEEKRK